MSEQDSLQDDHIVLILIKIDKSVTLQIHTPFHLNIYLIGPY